MEEAAQQSEASHRPPQRSLPPKVTLCALRDWGESSGVSSFLENQTAPAPNRVSAPRRAAEAALDMKSVESVQQKMHPHLP